MRSRDDVFDIALIAADPRRDAPVLRVARRPARRVLGNGATSTSTPVSEYLAERRHRPAPGRLARAVDGVPIFFVETYDPRHVLLPGIHDAEAGDLGMHVLIAPPPATTRARTHRRGVRRRHARGASMTSAPSASSSNRTCATTHRRQECARRLPRAARGRRCPTATAPQARPRCRSARATTFAVRLAATGTHSHDLPQSASHLTPQHIAAAQRHLVAKAIAEFSARAPARPEPDRRGSASDGWRRTPTLEYRFRASASAVSSTGSSTRTRRTVSSTARRPNSTRRRSSSSCSRCSASRISCSRRTSRRSPRRSPAPRSRSHRAGRPPTS